MSRGASGPAAPHFPGLDSLRAYAALFVVIGHVPLNQASLGLPNPHYGALFFRGATAVSFFFTLSGFLITYLLLGEQARRGRIDVKAFYLRRVLRIWPLYYTVVLCGLLFYNALLPRLGIAYEVRYPLPLAAALYVLFLPNLMNSLYAVGGILNPTWSIGIEEQFYLSWAPALRRWHHRLPALAAAVLVASLATFLLSPLAVGEVGWAPKFLDQLKFHFMAAGALAAWALFHHRERLLASPVFRRPWLQGLLGLLVVQFYFVDVFHFGRNTAELFQLALYPWLLVEIGANPARRLPLTNRPAEYLGRISYGLYMLHMPVVYATSWLLARSGWLRGHLLLYVLAYYGLALGLTVGVAALSYRYLETPILRLKERFSR